MNEDTLEEVEFIVVDERGAQATLECPGCGLIFEVDAYTSLNLEWSRPQKAMVAKCPVCNRRQR